MSPFRPLLALLLVTTAALPIDAQPKIARPTYRPIAQTAIRTPAFRAALDLVFKGVEQPSGYTEPLLHAWRRRKKAG